MPDLIPYPVFSNQHTFLRCPSARIEDVAAGDVAVFGVPQDTTAASRPGARWGPASIRAASAGLDYFLRSSLDRELVDVETGQTLAYQDKIRLVDCGDVMTYPLDLPRTVASVSADVAAIRNRGALPVALGGDHFVSYPVCLGVVESLRAANPSFRLGYIHIDGDLDISDDNRTWGRLFHGTNARRIAEIEGVDRTRMVMFGISGVTRRDQWEFVHDEGITMITAGEIARVGARAAMERAIGIAMDGTDGVYVTCDIDVVDGAIAPGTGAIKFVGISASDLLDAGTALSKIVHAIVGLDVVEVAPEWDPMGRTPVLAASYLTNVLEPLLFATGTASRDQR